jgi:alpha-tubulin suppressor-like RCC1 family protein
MTEPAQQYVPRAECSDGGSGPLGSARKRSKALFPLLVTLAVVAILSGCDDGPSEPNSYEYTLPYGLAVSDPVGTSRAGALAAAATDGLVYVSASPATFPDGVSVTITNLANRESLSTDIIDGGFDPVAVPGSPGAELELVVRSVDGSTTVFRTMVPTRKRPRVVRTRPSKDATDVGLSTTVLVVFSEPIDDKTITLETITLLVNEDVVEGDRVLDPERLRAEFAPTAGLMPQTTYTLVITSGLQDLAGDPLQEEVVVTFETQPAVASVTVAPDDVAISVGQQAQLLAILNDAQGNTLVGREVLWSSSDEAVAVVDSWGVVTGIGLGSARVAATSEGISDTAAVTVGVARGFVQVSAGFGGLHTCGVTSTGQAYCWGHPTDGQLGIGTSLPPDDQLTPAPVQGGITFARVSAGGLHTCGFTTNGTAYCWGYNFFGNLGDGDVSGSSKYTPVPVVGGFRLADVSSGNHHSCGASTTGEAFCWGADYSGELGDGGGTYFGHRPVRVVGGHSFADVSVGASFSCGITSDGHAYCWGWNAYGQLGNGSTNGSTVPAAVSGGLSFLSVSAGGYHACGISTIGELYCWGDDRKGQLGSDGSAPDTCEDNEGSWPCSTEPLLTQGGLTFVSVSAGGDHTCGITTGGETYCWGDNEYGELGNGSTDPSSTPQPIAAGIILASISAGWDYTCGVTGEGAAYCWGRNHHGALGDGTKTDRTMPVPVAGQQ